MPKGWLDKINGEGLKPKPASEKDKLRGSLSNSTNIPFEFQPTWVDKILGDFNTAGLPMYRELYKDKLKKELAKSESGSEKDPYKAVNPDTGALGKYQFLPDVLTKDWKITDHEAFLNNPQLQEDLMEKQSYYLFNRANALSKLHGSQLGDNLMNLSKGVHFKGNDGLYDELTGKSSLDKSTKINPSTNEYINRTNKRNGGLLKYTNGGGLIDGIKQQLMPKQPAQNKYQVMGTNSVQTGMHQDPKSIGNIIKDNDGLVRETITNYANNKFTQDSVAHPQEYQNPNFTRKNYVDEQVEHKYNNFSHALNMYDYTKGHPYKAPIVGIGKEIQDFASGVSDGNLMSHIYDSPVDLRNDWLGMKAAYSGVNRDKFIKDLPNNVNVENERSSPSVKSATYSDFKQNVLSPKKLNSYGDGGNTNSGDPITPIKNTSISAPLNMFSNFASNESTAVENPVVTPVNSGGLNQAFMQAHPNFKSPTSNVGTIMGTSPFVSSKIDSVPTATKVLQEGYNKATKEAEEAGRYKVVMKPDGTYGTAFDPTAPMSKGATGKTEAMVGLNDPILNILTGGAMGMAAKVGFRKGVQDWAIDYIPALATGLPLPFSPLGSINKLEELKGFARTALPYWGTEQGLHMGHDSGHTNTQETHRHGGKITNKWIDKYDKGGLLEEDPTKPWSPTNLDGYNIQNPVTSNDSLAHQAGKTMDYEYLKGSASGTGLPNYGNPLLGSNPTKDDSVSWYMGNIAPKLSHFNSAMEKGEAGDFLYNSGKDARVYAYQEFLKSTDPNNKLGWQDANGNWKDRNNLPTNFDSIYDNSVGKLPENNRRITVNKGRDWYYKNINKKPDGTPSDAYNNTWYGRIWNTNDYTNFNPNNPNFKPKQFKQGGKITNNWLDKL